MGLTFELLLEDRNKGLVDARRIGRVGELHDKCLATDQEHGLVHGFQAKACAK